MKIKLVIYIFLLSILPFVSIFSQQVYRIGIIGLDTSHSPAFIKMLNSSSPSIKYKNFRITAAYPYGSSTIKSSFSRIPMYTEEAKKYGVEIVGSITELLQKVDFIMLETNDGNMHLKQAAEVFKSGKPVFIDKPIAATLSDAIAIYMLANKYNVPVFSSSPLRYTPQNQDIRYGKYGKVIGADCYSPAHGEPSHPDFSWYGIHGIEILYTIMGTGCEKVNRVHCDSMDVVTGLWKDGRIGSFRGFRNGRQDYGGTVFCENTIVNAGGYVGHMELLNHILDFFMTKTSPVSMQETIEIFAFMAASNESIKHQGIQISIQSVLEKGREQAKKTLSKYGLY